ncbi:hypothetical protein WL29_23165 [Burkholderia ubonensis]|uniref:Uncharacterized protein n=1 Tax=Burkholderia ubonensis TaxID=101571 RepID=A0A106QDK9_9BURK|nr:hypothetical protein WL29_23165 [Burkholderia ubonensis]
MAEPPRILIVGADPSLAAVLAEKLAGQATVEVVEALSELSADGGAQPVLLDFSELPEVPAAHALQTPLPPSNDLERLLPPPGYGPPHRGKKGKLLRW